MLGALRRLALVLWLAAFAALALDKWVLPYSDPGIGFYLVGGTILTGALASGNGMASIRAESLASDRELRINAAFAYVLVGVAVLVLGAVIEAFAPSWA